MYNYPLALTQQFRFCGNPFRLDMYRGCDFGCKYCFANTRQGGFQHMFDEANIDIIKKYFAKAFDSNKPSKNITIELLRNRVPIHIGGMADPFQTREFNLKLTYQVIEISNKYHYPLIFSTKTAHLPDEYFDILNPEIHAFQISLMGMSDDFIRKYETNTPLANDRIGFVKKLKDKGFWVSVRIQPLIDIHEAELVVLGVNDLVDYITIEHLKVPTDNKIVRNLFEPFNDKYYRPKSSRNFELKKEIKIENIEYLKSISKIPIGVGDNELHYLSDSNCCCGIDTINENFNNYLKYNLCYFSKDNCKDVFCPENSVSSCLNPETRKKGVNDFKTYTDLYCESHKEFMNLDKGDKQ